MNVKAERFLNELYEEPLWPITPYNDALDITRAICVFAARDADDLIERMSPRSSGTQALLEVMFSLPSFTLIHYMDYVFRFYVELLIHFYFKKCGEHLTKEERLKCRDAVLETWSENMCDEGTASCATVEGLMGWVCDDVKPPVDEIGIANETACELIANEVWIEDRRAGKGIPKYE